MMCLPQKCLPGIPVYALTLRCLPGRGLLSFPVAFLCFLDCQHSGLCLLVVLLLGTHMLKTAEWSCRMEKMKLVAAFLVLAQLLCQRPLV